MPDWLQFSILDMTPYDRRGWFRLIESYQQDFAYLPILSLICSALLAFLIFRPVSKTQTATVTPTATMTLTPTKATSATSATPRLALALLAVSWGWCGWVFQMQYHANLNWAAPQFGWVFIAQAGLLMLVAIFGKTLTWRATGVRHQWPDLLILLLALLYPVVGLFEGRGASQLEWLGLMPAPTTLATLGLLMLFSSRWRWLLLPIPVLWGLVSAAFTWRLDLWEPYVTAVALVLCVVSYLLVKLFPKPTEDQATFKTN